MSDPTTPVIYFYSALEAYGCFSNFSPHGSGKNTLGMILREMRELLADGRA